MRGVPRLRREQVKQSKAVLIRHGRERKKKKKERKKSEQGSISFFFFLALKKVHCFPMQIASSTKLHACTLMQLMVLVLNTSLNCYMSTFHPAPLLNLAYAHSSWGKKRRT